MTKKEMMDDIIRLYPDKDENPVFVNRVIKKGDAATDSEVRRIWKKYCANAEKVQNPSEVAYNAVRKAMQSLDTLAAMKAEEGEGSGDLFMDAAFIFSRSEAPETPDFYANKKRELEEIIRQNKKLAMDWAKFMPDEKVIRFLAEY